jgi:hypothetical protein
MRVWSNFNNSKNPVLNEDLGRKLRDAFLTALKKTSPHDTMAYLLSEEMRKDLKGLNVSFLSKHLRMLQPERFATLDSVLEKSTGFAMNPTGYQIFMNSLDEQIGTAKRLSGKSFHIADFEAAIFLLSRNRNKEYGVSKGHLQFLKEARDSLK